jgi:hypothetical protein
MVEDRIILQYREDAVRFGRAIPTFISRHNVRRPADKKMVPYWNAASDLVLNDPLFKYYGFDLPDGETVLSKTDFKGVDSVEEVFNWIVDQLPDNPDPSPGDSDEEGDGDGDSSSDGSGKGKGSGKSDSGSSGKKNDGDKDDDKGDDQEDDSNGENEDKDESQDDGDNEDNDDSDDSDDANSDIDEAGLEKLIQKLADETKYDEKEAEQLEKHVPSAGNGASTFIKTLQEKQIVKKRKWETIIHSWALESLQENENSSWVKNPVRLSSLLEELDSLLPGQTKSPIKTLSRIPVMFVCDVSGSCQHLFERFVTAAKSLPEDRFDIYVYSFDTQIHEIDQASWAIRGGGGTLMQPVFDRYVELQAEYPSLVMFCLTDMDYFDSCNSNSTFREGGYGLTFPQELANRFNIFLPGSPYDKVSKIPPGFKKFDLKNFE